jgi:predicted RNase H-like HicB family nuclease
MSKATKYSFIVQYSDEDTGYIARVPEFRTCSGFGETADEAVRQAQTAIDLFVAEYEAQGQPLPEPILLNHFALSL